MAPRPPLPRLDADLGVGAWRKHEAARWRRGRDFRIVGFRRSGRLGDVQLQCNMTFSSRKAWRMKCIMSSMTGEWWPSVKYMKGLLALMRPRTGHVLRACASSRWSRRQLVPLYFASHVHTNSFSSPGRGGALCAVTNVDASSRATVEHTV